MANIRLHFFAAILALCLSEIHGHGRMVDPMGRSSMGTSGLYPEVPANYDHNENFCGGQFIQHNENGGRCGPCGDNYKDPVPRDNENGGLYGTGIIVKKYKAGERIRVGVILTANHLGYFQFNICELKNETDVETENCFDQHPLKLIDERGKINDRYNAGSKNGLHKVEVLLPSGFRCRHCVLRWHYTTGNNWGTCADGVSGLGCAPDPEMFRSCADIAIV